MPGEDYNYGILLAAGPIGLLVLVAGVLVDWLSVSWHIFSWGRLWVCLGASVVAAIVGAFAAGLPLWLCAEGRWFGIWIPWVLGLELAKDNATELAWLLTVSLLAGLVAKGCVWVLFSPRQQRTRVFGFVSALHCIEVAALLSAMLMIGLVVG